MPPAISRLAEGTLLPLMLGGKKRKLKIELLGTNLKKTREVPRVYICGRLTGPPT